MSSDQLASRGSRCRPVTDSRRAELSWWQSPEVGLLRLWAPGHAPNPFRVADLVEAVRVVDDSATRAWLVQWRVQRWSATGAGGFGWADVPVVELDAARAGAR